VDLASRLIRSGDPDDRLRGLERAAAIHTPEAVSLVIHSVKEPRQLGPDTRALLVAVRGLADATGQSEVRSFLKDAVLNVTLAHHSAATTVEPDPEDGDRSARLALARSEAAFALATSADPKAVETVVLVARDPGPGQAAAAEAIEAFPPERVAAIGTGPLSPTLLRLAAEMGDLRTLDSVRTALHASDAPSRAAALDATASLGDGRSLADARALFKDSEPSVRAAAGGALVRLGAPERCRVVEALVNDDETFRDGVRLATLAADAGVARALAARVKASGDTELRALAIVALGQADVDEAVEALAELAKDPTLAGDAAAALARSPSRRAVATVESWLRSAPLRRLGARAYVLRALTRNERAPSGASTLLGLARSPDKGDRAVGLSALVLLGEGSAALALQDPEASVRRVVATAATMDREPATRRALLQIARSEPDALARRVERAALAGGDPQGEVTTAVLAERAVAGEADGPLATLALAARGDPDHRARVDALLASSDPILRAHAARGLGESAEAEATGRLAAAFSFEVDPLVRRALVLALARRAGDEGAPGRKRVLEKAARLDPDRTVRDTAARALRGLPTDGLASLPMEVAWLRLATKTGQEPGDSSRGGVVLRSDGLAVPVAFDPDGYALVPVPPGEARLLLEPRVPAYE